MVVAGAAHKAFVATMVGAAKVVGALWLQWYQVEALGGAACGHCHGVPAPWQNMRHPVDNQQPQEAPQLATEDPYATVDAKAMPPVRPRVLTKTHTAGSSSSTRDWLGGHPEQLVMSQ